MSEEWTAKKQKRFSLHSGINQQQTNVHHQDDGPPLCFEKQAKGREDDKKDKDKEEEREKTVSTITCRISNAANN